MDDFQLRNKEGLRSESRTLV